MLEYSREIAASKDLTTLRDSLVRYVSQAERVLSDLYNVVGDGITDDTVALNAALAAGGFIELTEAVYIITDKLQVIVDGTTLYSNVGSEILQISSNKNAIEITASNVSIIGIKVKGVQYALQKDEWGIKAYGADSLHYISGLRIENCIIENWGFEGIDTLFVENFTIANNRIKDINYAGVMMLSSRHGDVYGNKIENVIYTVNAYGIEASRWSIYTLAAHPRSSDINIHNNFVKDIPTWKGLGTHGGQRVSFYNNKVENCLIGIGIGGCKNESDLEVYAPFDCSAIGNEIVGSLGIRTCGIWLCGAQETATVYERGTGIIQGNTISQMGEDIANGMAIYCRTTLGVVIEGNTIFEPAGSGIFSTTENIGMVISNNTIINPWRSGGAGNYAWGIRFNDVNNTATIEGNTIIWDADRWTLLGVTAPTSTGIGIGWADKAGCAFKIGQNTCNLPYYIDDMGQRGIRGSYTPVVSSSGTGEDDLMTQVIPAGYIGIGSRLRIVCAGDITGLNGNKTIKFYFGSGSYTFYAAANHNDYWRFEAEIVCDVLGSQKISWKGYDGVIITQGYADGAEAMTAAIMLKCTGECAHASDVITQKFMDIRID